MTTLKKLYKEILREKRTVDVGTTAHAICSMLQLRIENELLEEEEQQIIDAHFLGQCGEGVYSDEDGKIMEIEAKQYYKSITDKP